MGAWIDWEEATLTWRPDGWTLTVPLELDEREAHLLEPLVKELVPQTTSVWASPGPGGSLRLEDPALPTALNPSHLRSVIQSMADEAVARARVVAEHDEHAKEAFLRELRELGLVRAYGAGEPSHRAPVPVSRPRRTRSDRPQ